MLDEAHLILRLIRFVANVISGTLGWIRRLHEDKPLSNRKLVKQLCFTLRRKYIGGEFFLSFRWVRSEETGPNLIAPEGRAVQKRIAQSQDTTIAH